MGDTLSARDIYRWVMVCTGCVDSVCVSSFGEGLAVWVLLPRVDRGRRADRVGLVLQDSYISDHARDFFGHMYLVLYSIVRVCVRSEGMCATP